MGSGRVQVGRQLEQEPGISVNEWILKVEVNGEWEECSFPSRTAALSAFTALSADYCINLQRAILIAPRSNPAGLDKIEREPQNIRRPN
jgi:hypothetical protein